MKTDFIQNALTATQAPRRRPLKKEMEARRQSQLQDIGQCEKDIVGYNKRILDELLREKNGQCLPGWKEKCLKYRAEVIDRLFSKMSNEAVLDTVIKILPR